MKDPCQNCEYAPCDYPCREEIRYLYHLEVLRKKGARNEYRKHNRIS